MVAGGDELIGREVLFDITPQDGVELLVGREAVGVLLPRLQLGRGWLGEDALGDGGAKGVAIPAQLVHRRLGDVLEHGETAGHVAVKGAVAGGDLRLVAGREHDVAELVRQCVQDHAANPRLQVLLRDPGPRPFEGAGQDLLERPMGRFDGEVEQLDPEGLRHQPGVLEALGRGIAGRHAHRDHVLGAECVSGDRGGEGRVHSTREPDDDLLEKLLADVVVDAERDRGIDFGGAVERSVHVSRKRGAGGSGARRHRDLGHL